MAGGEAAWNAAGTPHGEEITPRLPLSIKYYNQHPEQMRAFIEEWLTG